MICSADSLNIRNLGTREGFRRSIFSFKKLTVIHYSSFSLFFYHDRDRLSRYCAARFPQTTPDTEHLHIRFSMHSLPHQLVSAKLANSKPNQGQPVSCPQKNTPLGQTHHRRCCSAAKTINDHFKSFEQQFVELLFYRSSANFDLEET